MIQARTYHIESSDQTKLIHEKDMEIQERSEIRESLRDDMQLSVQQNNTTLVCNTLMTTCAFALIVEGKLPDIATNLELDSYTLFLNLSTASLISGLWLGFIIFRRINKYQIHLNCDRRDYIKW